ncbi:membrane protein insertase YidC [Lapillicoccus sp.]|uniref:membrane protein insertase YidC n=1 Tax=Lapillicoccus sp. TaxID=1909287 RepID=UPI0025DCEF32|nr:membrane protein insertase YidC [Lapillicoccus sp.]
MPDLLSPVTTVIAAILARTHSLAGLAGLAPGSGGAWLLAILLLVIIVRTAMLPLTIHGVRSAHARARATPQLQTLQRRYAGARDRASLRQLRDERRRINAEHGVSTWSLAPMVLQLPLVYALYRVVSDLTTGHSVGAMGAALVASASAASLLGLTLTSRIGPLLLQHSAAAVVLVMLALVAAALTFATQQWFNLPMTSTTDLSGQPAGIAAIQRLMPWLAGGGVLVAAWFVPAGLLVYWVINNAWTFAQQGLVWRFAPTPGSPAARQRAERAAVG